MESHFEHDIGDLKQRLLAMAGHAETAVNLALQALLNRDYDLAVRVKQDDNLIDRFEVEIDELAIHLLAKAPLASDLRLITVAMKISQNLERVGDEATKIAKRARDLAQDPPLKLNLPLTEMAGLSLQLLRSALDCFVKKDAATARTLITRDHEVDALIKDIHRQLMLKTRSVDVRKEPAEVFQDTLDTLTSGGVIVQESVWLMPYHHDHAAIICSKRTS